MLEYHSRAFLTQVIVGHNYLGLTGTDLDGVFEKDNLSEAEAQAQ